MNFYKIVDNGQEEYVIPAENALNAIVRWMKKYHNPEVIEFIADHGYEYFARLQITKVDRGEVRTTLIKKSIEENHEVLKRLAEE